MTGLGSLTSSITTINTKTLKNKQKLNHAMLKLVHHLVKGQCLGVQVFHLVVMYQLWVLQLI